MAARAPQFILAEGEIEFDAQRLRADVTLEYGKNREGYFNAKLFGVQLQHAADVATVMFPTCRVVFMLDNSGCHNARRPGGLDADEICLGDDKLSTLPMRNTEYVDNNGVTRQQTMGKKGVLSSELWTGV